MSIFSRLSRLYMSTFTNITGLGQAFDRTILSRLLATPGVLYRATDIDTHNFIDAKVFRFALPPQYSYDLSDTA